MSIMDKVEDRVNICKAAAQGREGLCEELLSQGEDVNCTDQLGWTPLMHAVHNGHSRLVRALLSHGAQPCLCTHHGITAFTMAVLHFDDDIFKRLYEGLMPEQRQQESDIALQVASVIGSYDAAQWLLRNTTVQVNTISPLTGVTPLMLAAMCSGDCKLAELLLTYGANPSLTSALGQDLFDLASVTGNRELSNLLHHECSPTQPNCFSFKKVKNIESVNALNMTNNIHLDIPENVVLKNSPTHPVFKCCKNDKSGIKYLPSPSMRSVFVPQQGMSQSCDSNGLRCQYDIAAMVSPCKSTLKSPNKTKKRKLSNVNGISSWFKRITKRRTKSLPDEDDFDDLNVLKPAKIDFSQLLISLGLDEFSSVFKEQELDIWTFLSLTTQDLEAMGIDSPSSQTHILKSIQTLRKTHL